MSFFSSLRGGWRTRRWLPGSRLGRLTVYFLGLDLLFFLVARLSALLDVSWGASIQSWVRLLTFAACVLGMLWLLRWTRRRLLWRLRNRLIVTYTFIGVIPVVLLLVMGALASSLFAWQFAAFVASADLHSELQSLAALNSRLTAEVALQLREGAPPSPRLLQRATLREKDAMQRDITAWYGGVALVPDPSATAIAPPAAQTPAMSAIVIDGGRLALRAADTVDINGRQLIVISSTPLDRGLLARLAANLGVLTIAPPDAAAPDFDSVSAGSKPAVRNPFDREIYAPSLLAAQDWPTGKPRTAVLLVDTRLSMLYAQLFRTVGEFTRYMYEALAGIAIFFALIELLALITGLRLSRTMTRSVAELYDATRHVNRGDFTHRIQVKADDQLASLERSFNSMTASLEQLIAEQKEKQRMENELAIAQEVQAQLFPREIAQLPALELHGVCRPARTVSGDYYDFLDLGGGRLGLAVGDISGKGISAALLMATIHSAMRAYTLEAAHAVSALAEGRHGAGPGAALALDANGALSPAALCRRLNRQLFSSTPAEKYATLFLGIYDSASRSLAYTNAGHLAPIILKQDGSLRRLETGGTVIGLFPDVGFQEAEIQLAPGDVFLSYSDGVTEPENEFGEFGETRLIELVQKNRRLPLERITQIVVAAVLEWIGGGEQPDDITVVLARPR